MERPNIAGTGMLVSYIKTFLAHNNSLGDWRRVIKEFDADGKIRGAVRQIKPKHLHVVVASLAMQELVRLLYLLSRFYSNTPSFRLLYTNARTVKDLFKSNFLTIAVDTNMDIMSQFQEMTGFKSPDGAAAAAAPPAASVPAADVNAVQAGYDSDFDYECDREYKKHAEKSGDAKIKQMYEDDDGEEEYDYLEDFENDQTLSEDDKILKRRKREDKELLLDSQLRGFMDWINCFYAEMNKPDMLEKLKVRDEALFESSGLSWLSEKSFLRKVDKTLDPNEYPHDAVQALEELKALDDGREEDKKRLPRVWNYLGNLMLMAQFLVTVHDTTIQELLDNLNQFIDDFLAGKIENVAQIQEKLMEEINKKLPQMKSIALQLKDLILATVFHNLDKFRKQLHTINTKYGTEIQQLSAEFGVPVDLNHFENVFENNVVKQIVSLHNGEGLIPSTTTTVSGPVGQESAIVQQQQWSAEQMQQMARDMYARSGSSTKQ